MKERHSAGLAYSTVEMPAVMHAAAAQLRALARTRTAGVRRERDTLLRQFGLDEAETTLIREVGRSIWALGMEISPPLEFASSGDSLLVRLRTGPAPVADRTETVVASPPSDPPAEPPRARWARPVTMIAVLLVAAAGVVYYLAGPPAVQREAEASYSAAAEAALDQLDVVDDRVDAGVQLFEYDAAVAKARSAAKDFEASVGSQFEDRQSYSEIEHAMRSFESALTRWAACADDLSCRGVDVRDEWTDASLTLTSARTAVSEHR